MKLSLNWLKDYVDLDMDVASLSHKLTMAGLEIESVSKVGADTVVELEITPNRADCLSVIGLAREVATIFDKRLKEPLSWKAKLPTKKVSISIEDSKDCAMYQGVLLSNVSVKPSSSYIQKRLISVGLRPVNNLVDITNFCLMEYGQPLHVFDYDKLDGGCIQVRRARKGEKMVTLDGEARELDPGILVIADASKPVAVAGIMGGRETEVTSETQRVLLESARFDPVLIRRSSRRLGLSSDSSYRFERGVDPSGVQRTSARALRLIVDEAEGQPEAYGRGGSVKVKRGRAVVFATERAAARMGMPLSRTKVKKIFKKLNFEVSDAPRGLSVTPPPARRDIEHDVDLIEEVARVIGYDNIPEERPVIRNNTVPVNGRRLARERLRSNMLSQGFDEMISFSLISRQDLARAGLSEQEVVTITNPLSLDQEVLQPSTLPSVLQIVRTNINRGSRNLRLFELTRIYSRGTAEKEVLSLVMCGDRRQDWRELKCQPVDIYDLKGAVMQALRRSGMGRLRFDRKGSAEHQENKAMTLCDEKGTRLGCIGGLRPEVLQEFGVKNTDVYFGEIEIPLEQAQNPDVHQYKPLSAYPAVTRDVSLAVDHKVTYQEILDLLRREGGALLRDITFAEQYLGDKIPADQRGLISLFLTNPMNAH